jgi:hypothetical protein
VTGVIGVVGVALVVVSLVQTTLPHAQDVALGEAPQGIKLSLERLIRRDKAFSGAMSVHLILENVSESQKGPLSINCRAVDVDGFTIERSSVRDRVIEDLQPGEKVRKVVTIPEHASTNKVVCNIN